MKAIHCTRYGPPEVLKLVEVVQPVPGARELCVRVRATSVTVADFRIRSFTIPAGFWLPARLMLGLFKPRKPILGVELSGVVEAVGSGVTRFKPGDAVLAATLMGGGYAEYACVPEKSTAHKPDALSFAEAAALPVGAFTAWQYLRLGKVHAGQKVLVYGASGSVGTYAVQLAKGLGAEVTGVCSAANRELVLSLGADKVLDYKAPDFTRQLEKYDVIFIAVDQWPFAVCKHFLTETGTYLNVTAPFKSFDMIRTGLTSRKQIRVGQDFPIDGETLAYLAGLAASGQLKVVIDRTYPLEEIVAAHHYVALGHKKGNVSVTVS